MDIENGLIMGNSIIIALYFLYVIKRSNTQQFAEMRLNENVRIIKFNYRLMHIGKKLLKLRLIQALSVSLAIQR